MADSVLPDILRKEDHIRILDEMAAERIEDLDLSVILVYLIDNAPAEALPALAVQFNVLGYKGWKFATTDAMKRDLLKKAIEIHRYKGTPWSIEEALKTIGVTGTIGIQEGIYYFYDGFKIHDGTITYGGNGWAIFRVLISAVNLTNFNVDDLKKIILEYKNVRSHLEDVSLAYDFAETITSDEENELGLDPAPETLGPFIWYNGAAVYNGSSTHNGGEYDDFTLAIGP